MSETQVDPTRNSEQDKPVERDDKRAGQDRTAEQARPAGQDRRAGQDRPASQDRSADRARPASQDRPGGLDRTARQDKHTEQAEPAGQDRTAVPHTAAAPAASTGAAPGADAAGRLGRRMEHAIGGFVDDPRRAVREADDVLDEAIRHMQQLVESRRTALRTGSKDGADTEELRVALTRYRDLTDRLIAF
ncbi:hypothetical protein NMG29_06375 [Streptomyces cocklensis]|uniref:Eukaryotic translation initiation factor 3 110 kDa subunit n=1 Tax=Actinacidiphila cocklensis TaxID=887465 RepID=A0A9W4GQI5_9ACTN|nr:hypothetical protein [Actinacidiphila cocklensis]MDD1057856.1 hypothetical protein [Actinacidiphila cocklensis]CAG6392714.1 Eukaryotic translation initiation factor 3 110 kDa subunit [Actinacidiphila cocklensis]